MIDPTQECRQVAARFGYFHNPAQKRGGLRGDVATGFKIFLVSFDLAGPALSSMRFQTLEDARIFPTKKRSRTMAWIRSKWCHLKWWVLSWWGLVFWIVPGR